MYNHANGYSFFLHMKHTFFVFVNYKRQLDSYIIIFEFLLVKVD